MTLQQLTSITVAVIEVVQPIGTFYLAAIPAQQLLQITYSDVRRLADEQRDVERYLGIQRPVSPQRIRQIRRYLQSPDATFPTGVLVAVDERCAEYDRDARTLTLKPFVPEDDAEEAIPLSKVAKVLDGQHRLAGFLDEEENWIFDFDENTRFDLNVAIFIGADLSEQATVFATVNLAQTKVNRSLVYDLEDFSRSRSPFKTCHNIAVALNGIASSPFYLRIKRLGVQTKGVVGETLTQASFVESLVQFISTDPLSDRNRLMDGRKVELEKGWESRTPFRRMFVEERDLDIAEIINNYFKAVRKKWPTAWKDTSTKGNLLPRTNAFKALMKYLKDDVYRAAAERDGKEIPSVETFLEFFQEVNLLDKEFTTRRFVPGSGGQSMFLKVLRGQVDPKTLFEPDDPSDKGTKSVPV